MNYLVDDGFISRGAHISYERSKKFETFEEAKKFFDSIDLEVDKNEYKSLSIYNKDIDDYEVVEYTE